MIPILVCYIFVILLIWAFTSMRKKALNLHAELDRVETIAKNAKTFDEVVTAFHELQALASECIGDPFNGRYSIIHTILKTKYDIYKELEPKKTS